MVMAVEGAEGDIFELPRLATVGCGWFETMGVLIGEIAIPGVEIVGSVGEVDVVILIFNGNEVVDSLSDTDVAADGDGLVGAVVDGVVVDEVDEVGAVEQ